MDQDAKPVAPVAAPTPQANAIADLNPVSLFKKSWQIFKQNWQIFVGIELISFVLLGVIAVIGLGISAYVFFVIANGQFDQLLAYSWMIFLTIGIMLLLIVLYSSVAQLALLVAVSRSDERFGVFASYKSAFLRMIPFAMFFLVYNFFTTGAFLLFIIPGVLFSVWFSQAVFIYLLEKESFVNSLMKSREYVRGHTVEVFLAIFVWGIAFAVLWSGLNTIESFLPEDSSFRSLISLFTFPLSFIVAPLQYIYLFAIYKELKRVKATPIQLPSKVPYVLVSLGGYLLFGFIMWTMLSMLVPVFTKFISERAAIRSESKEIIPTSQPQKETRTSNSPFDQADDTARRSAVMQLLNGIYQYSADHRGAFPEGITSTETHIGTSGVDLCSILVPEYMAALPIDPVIDKGGGNVLDCSKPYETGYHVYMSENSDDPSITVLAPFAVTQKIRVTR